jgi:cyclophilin family peptidyl-prolyl cis-trans isomerase/outer membrane protein OmpA-like peptidoglycan-associated protein
MTGSLPPLRSLLAAAALLAPAAALAQPTPALAPPAPVQPPAPPPLPRIEVTSSAVQLDGIAALSTDAVFDVGEATFRPAVTPLLDAIAKALAGNASPRFVVHVYADDTAPDNDRTGAWLVKLTQRRADALKAHFGKRGVPARKLAATGHGNASPIGDNRTEVGKRSNRRIEIAVESDVRPPAADDLATYLKVVRGQGRLVATIATNKGTLHCELFEQQAPATVANFIGLATGQKPWIDPKSKQIVKGKPFYDGLVFHRVIPQFMIQGGDPQGIGVGGPGYQFGDEISPALTHQPGTLSMANAGPGTNGSQFFINEIATPWLNGRHTVFGHCKEVDVITAISSVPRGPNDMPSDPVTITKLTVARTP